MAEKQQLLTFHREDFHPEGEYDIDTDNGQASLDTDRYGDCFPDHELCQGEVCTYDPEGEYDTDTDNGDIWNARTLLRASLDTGECQPG